jgi:hypothetical protein
LSSQAHTPTLLLGPTDAPLVVFNVDATVNAVARWDAGFLTWPRLGVIGGRMNLTASDAFRPRMARAGNTLVFAWIEGIGTTQIAVRRHHLDTGEWEVGAFVPGPTNPFDIDLALDSGGLVVIAYSDGALGSRLHALRETASGDWTSLGEIGVRPSNAPNVLEFGVHVDAADVIRIAWLEGSINYYLQVAQFDGAVWSPLPGRSETRFLQSSLPVRSLSVNRSPSLFAFAYALDISATDSQVGVQQLTSSALTAVGSSLTTTHPRVGHLSLTMAAESRATLTQSELDASGVYRLVVRRHVP